MNLSLFLFLIGILGFILNRKNIILMIIAIEIIKILKFCPMASSKLNELIKTNKVTANNIISIAIIINMMFFLFKINPKTPIKNKNNDKFIGINILIIP